MDTLRPKQAEILAYTGGKMGVSAVPGSGKTFTLSRLAAKLVLEGGMADDQEVLIVTLTNSAVENFYYQLSEQLRERGWFPNFGYRVRTLHGLGRDIIREHSAHLAISERAEVIDDREATLIRNEVARAWLASHRDFFDAYLKPDLEEYQRSRIAVKDYPLLVQDIALSFTRSAKNKRLKPQALLQRLEAAPDLPLARMGCDLYAGYQRSLEYRGALDFDDLIVLALDALESDPAYLERLRYRWPYILEDEAQDSSLLQEQILGRLSGDGSLPPMDVNWVRVGDPNQAIYETFTTASPRFLREFLQRPDVTPRDLPNSGRSCASIIRLANYLAAWAAEQHPVEAVRDALQPEPRILPIPPGDPQPLQPDDPNKVVLHLAAQNADQETETIAKSAQKWLGEHPQGTLAVLAPTNYLAEKLVDALKHRNIPYHDALLRAPSSARTTVRGFQAVLAYLCDPQSGPKLAELFQVWQTSHSDDRHQNDSGHAGAVKDGTEWLRHVRRVEDFLWPDPGEDLLEKGAPEEREPDPQRAGASPPSMGAGPQRAGACLHAQLSQFRQLVRRWAGAMQYPIDQVILTVAQDLLKDPLEWAVAQKLASHLRRAGRLNPAARLPEMLAELNQLESNAYKDFSAGETGFDPNAHRGEVVVATMHKAKGLEWERVYLMSVNSYDFPAALEGDSYRSEKWFFQPGFNFEAEALAQLKYLTSKDAYAWYEEGRASQAARVDVARERLRLLYVGITRAKRELVITWNSGTRRTLKPALALTALVSFWEGYLSEQTVEA